MLAHILLADRLTYRALFGTFYALMEPSKRTNIRRFLGGVVCGVLGILLFESHGTAAALAGGIGGFALGALLPSMAQFWRYSRSVPDQSLDQAAFDAEVKLRHTRMGQSAIALVATCFIGMPALGVSFLLAMLDGFAGATSDLTVWIVGIGLCALLALACVTVVGVLITVGVLFEYAPDTDEHKRIRYERLAEQPLSTVWARQTRHLCYWTPLLGTMLIGAMLLWAIFSTTIWFKSGGPWAAMQRWTLALRRASAKYAVSAAVSVTTMLACAFAAKPYLDGALLPWIALGTGALCGGASLLVPITLSQERSDAAITRLDMWHSRMFERRRELYSRLSATYERVLTQTGQSLIGTPFEQIAVILDGDPSETINY